MFLNTGDLRTPELALRLEKTTDAIPEKRYVPAYHFTIHRAGDAAEVGTCTLRIGNTQMLFWGGNIGYVVHREHRGHHYAAKAARLLLGLARRHGMPYLYIACAPENHPSRRTCELLGAELLCIADLPTDTERYESGERQTCVYRVELGL